MDLVPSSVAQDVQIQGFSNHFSMCYRQLQQNCFRNEWESVGSVWKVRLFFLPPG